MPLKNGARIKESTLTTGTGALSLEGAESGYRSIVAGIGTGNQMMYWLLDANGIGWEMGIGTITDGDPDTFSRDTVLKSSNADAAIDLSAPSGAGKHILFNAPIPGFGDGDVDFNGLSIYNVADKVQTVASDAGVLTLDYKNGGTAIVTLTEAITSIVVNNVPAGGAMTVYFIQDATGGWAVDFTGFRTAGGNGVSLSTDPNAEDVVVFITKDGSTFDAGLFGAAFA